jgi:hypothetical protein
MITSSTGVVPPSPPPASPRGRRCRRPDEAGKEHHLQEERDGSGGAGIGDEWGGAAKIPAVGRRRGGPAGAAHVRHPPGAHLRTDQRAGGGAPSSSDAPEVADADRVTPPPNFLLCDILCFGGYVQKYLEN